jgi:2-dehydro-3-deoxyphosphogluconate aldolase/(4S)-4-hydroxy-2-oxoglutarate aldolase
VGLLKIGIARGVDASHIVPVFRAAFDGGIDHLEITMNTPGATELIAQASKTLGDTMRIGAGTVTSLSQCQAALRAGARFIVSPIIDIPLITFCRKKGIPVFPGALTPTEVFRAWEAGATMVKVFPIASMGGPAYIRELKGPFNSIKLLASGGVSPDRLEEYINAGTDGIAIGSQLFRKEWIEKGEYDRITETARHFV